MSRPYKLGKRAIAVGETRRRILDGAAQAYAEHGVRATSMQEVARRADVAPATVLNHFADPDRLVEAVVAHITDELAVPDPAIFDGLEATEARARALLAAVYAFYERSERWVAMFFRDRDDVPALRAGEAAVRAAIGDLVSVALGDQAGDVELVQVVGAALDPAFRGALIRAGHSPDDAIRQAGDLVVAWMSWRQETDR
jgi:AcrR family transcriptional regulator